MVIIHNLSIHSNYVVDKGVEDITLHLRNDKKITALRSLLYITLGMLNSATYREEEINYTT